MYILSVVFLLFFIWHKDIRHNVIFNNIIILYKINFFVYKIK